MSGKVFILDDTHVDFSIKKFENGIAEQNWNPEIYKLIGALLLANGAADDLSIEHESRLNCFLDLVNAGPRAPKIGRPAKSSQAELDNRMFTVAKPKTLGEAARLLVKRHEMQPIIEEICRIIAPTIKIVEQPLGRIPPLTYAAALARAKRSRYPFPVEGLRFGWQKKKSALKFR